jgi:hypothetical protein
MLRVEQVDDFGGSVSQTSRYSGDGSVVFPHGEPMTEGSWVEHFPADRIRSPIGRTARRAFISRNPAAGDGCSRSPACASAVRIRCGTPSRRCFWRQGSHHLRESAARTKGLRHRPPRLCPLVAGYERLQGRGTSRRHPARRCTSVAHHAEARPSTNRAAMVFLKDSGAGDRT